MDRTKEFGLAKTSLTPSHGESLADQSFQSFKTKEIRDSESPTRDLKFRSVGGGGVIVPDTSGWNIQKSSEVSPDGRAYRDETLATTEGVQKVKGGQAEFTGLNEEKSSGSYVGDKNNYVQQAADSVSTKLHEKVVTGDPASGRTEMKTSSLISSSSQMVTSKKSTTGDMPAAFDDYANEKLTNAIHEQQRQMQESRNEQKQSHHESSFQQTSQETHRESSNQYHTQEKRIENRSQLEDSRRQEQYQRQQDVQQNKHVQQREEHHQQSSQLTKEQLTEMKQLQKTIHTYDKSSPEYQKYVDYLAAQNGKVLSTTVERPKPNVKLITTKKQLDDGTIVTTRRYETEVDGTQTPSTVNYALNQEQINSSRNTTRDSRSQRLDEQDVFSRLSKTRDDTRTFSKTFDDQSTQITRDTDRRENVRSNVTDQTIESLRQKTFKKDLSQTMKNEKLTTNQFIDTERGTIPTRDSPQDIPSSPYNRNSNLTEQEIRHENIRLTHDTTHRPEGYEHPRKSNEIQPGYGSTKVESMHTEHTTAESHVSTKRTEHHEHNERVQTQKTSKDFTTHGFPSVRADIPTSEDRNYPNNKSQRPSSQLPSDDQGYPAARQHNQRPNDDYGYPSARSQRPSEDFGYPAARPTSQVPKEDVGYPAARPTGQRPSEDHGYPAARPTSQIPKEDVGYPAARPTGQRPSKDHGYPAARPMSQIPKEDVGYPAARPTGQRPSEDHGYPAAKPATQRPSEGHGYPATRAQQPRPSEDHGYPAVRPSAQNPKEDHGYPAARTVGRTEQIKSVKSERTDFRGSTDSLRSEVRLDAAHNAFASSLRCASPNVDHSRPNSQRSMRPSVGSVRSTHSPQKHDGRSPSRESGNYAESTFSFRSKVADKRNSTARSSVTSLKDRRSEFHHSNETIDLTSTHSEDKERPYRGAPKLPTEKSPNSYTTTRKSSEVNEYSGEKNTKRKIPASTTNTSVEPNEELLTKTKASVETESFKDDGVIEEPIMKRNYYKCGQTENGVFNPTPENTTNTRDRRQKSPSPRHEPIGIEYIDIYNIPSRRSTKSPSPLKTIHTTASVAATNTNKQINKTNETQYKQEIQVTVQDTSKPYTIHGTIPKDEPKGYVAYDVGIKIHDKQNRTTSKDVSYPAHLTSPKGRVHFD